MTVTTDELGHNLMSKIQCIKDCKMLIPHQMQVLTVHTVACIKKNPSNNVLKNTEPHLSPKLNTPTFSNFLLKMTIHMVL